MPAIIAASGTANHAVAAWFVNPMTKPTIPPITQNVAPAVNAKLTGSGSPFS